MQPDMFWHYKRLARQVARDIAQRVQRVDIQALAVSWEVIGVDLSYWQGNIDWDKLASMVDFVIIRAQYGNDWYDPRCDEYRNAAEVQITKPEKRLKAFGVYCYPKPRKAKNWETTAKNFFLKWKEKPGNIPPTFDLEESGGLDKNELGSWYEKLYNEFISLSRLALEQIMTYTSAGYLNRAIALTEWLKRTLLWVANWTLASEPIKPAEWLKKNWKIWQWSATGPAKSYGILGSRYVDLNRYNGTRADFEKEFGVISPPPPIGEDMKMRVTADVLNVRAGPGTTYDDLGDLHAGDVIDMLNIGGTSAWVQIKGGQYDGKWACIQLAAQRYCEPVE